MGLAVGKLVFQLRHDVMDMNRSPVEYGSAGRRIPADIWLLHSTWWDCAVMGNESKHVTIKTPDKSVVCLAEPCGILSDGIKDRLEVSR